MKIAHGSSAEKPSAKKQRRDDLKERTKEIEADIRLLKEQINDKRAMLRQLTEMKEEKKRRQLLQILKASGISIDELIERLREPR